MNQVTFATAKSLKEAGFPQPKPEPEQFRYDESGLLFIVSEITSSATVEIFLIGVQSVFRTESIDRFVYAPDVDYIMDRLPHGTILEFWESHASASNRDDENPIRGYGETFAEAAADLWIKLNETPSKTFVKPGAPGE